MTLLLLFNALGHHHVQPDSGTHSASYQMGSEGSYLKDKASRTSPPSSAEVKNVWNYTSTPPIRFHGVMLD
jgi:hypothetical protein